MHSAPDQENEKEELNPEKESQQQQSDFFSEEVPEGEMATSWAAWAAYFIGKPLKNREDILLALKHVNHANFEHELLKVRDPVKFQMLTRDFQISLKEIEKQRKSKKGQKRGYAQVGMGPFKRYKEQIVFDAFDRKEQAFKLATAVQNKINTDEYKLKIAKTSEVFGLNEENTTKLRKNAAEWQKENPGTHIDQYFHSFGQRFHLEQQLISDRKLNVREKNRAIKKLAKKQNKQLAETSKTLFSELDKARVEVLHSNREQIITAQAEIKQLLDPSKAVVTDESLKQIINRTLHPEKVGETTTITPTPIFTAESTTVAPAAPIQTTETITPTFEFETTTTAIPQTTAETHPVEPNREPTIGKKDGGPPPPSGGGGRMPSLRMPSLSNITSRFNFGGLSNIGSLFSRLGNLSNIGGSFISKGLLKLGGKLGLGKLALKAGLQATLGAATAGIYTAASIIAGLFGIDLDKIALWGAIIAVGVPVGLLLIMLMSSRSSNQFGAGPENAYPVTLNNENKNNYSWNSFERNILGVEIKKTFSWDEFEEKYLTVKREFLSLEK
ncbi:hypothetical protein A2W14_01880 [Candidatus Gottesmanbacteria bacterium RBG_16_37_8]|uniref:Uncharacterized protein n=1 Tax=Candidatus Gottesmanbacteria bacterium RBG_16_37_8 TaxID=1798371 RepID=A0A1F5YPW0_9BACT|nr:MAG: hypothetical protein A2W14_01880 [Candidatus Gottesmanbacteria bacterium RBG_16_37_8]